MSTNFPTGYDTNANLGGPFSNAVPPTDPALDIDATHSNNLNDSVFAIEARLGIYDESAITSLDWATLTVSGTPNQGLRFAGNHASWPGTISEDGLFIDATTGNVSFHKSGDAVTIFTDLTSGGRGVISSWNDLYATGTQMDISGSTMLFAGNSLNPTFSMTQIGAGDIFTAGDGSVTMLQLSNRGTLSSYVPDLNGPLSGYTVVLGLTSGISPGDFINGVHVVAEGTPDNGSISGVKLEYNASAGAEGSVGLNVMPGWGYSVSLQDTGAHVITDVAQEPFWMIIGTSASDDAGNLSTANAGIADMIRVSVMGSTRWVPAYNNITLPEGTTTLDDAYTNFGGAGTVNIDAGNLTWRVPKISTFYDIIWTDTSGFNYLRTLSSLRVLQLGSTGPTNEVFVQCLGTVTRQLAIETSDAVAPLLVTSNSSDTVATFSGPSSSVEVSGAASSALTATQNGTGYILDLVASGNSRFYVKATGNTTLLGLSTDAAEPALKIVQHNSSGNFVNFDGHEDLDYTSSISTLDSSSGIVTGPHTGTNGWQFANKMIKVTIKGTEYWLAAYTSDV